MLVIPVCSVMILGLMLVPFYILMFWTMEANLSVTKEEVMVMSMCSPILETEVPYMLMLEAVME